MRLNLYWRGWDLIDIEAHLLSRRRDDDDMIVVRTLLEGSEMAEEIEPDTRVFGFGFGA